MLYIHISSEDTAEVELTVISSIIIEDNVSLVVASDEYDFPAHGGARYYRFFVCDMESVQIDLGGDAVGVQLYVNAWQLSVGSDEPLGRPSATNYLVSGEASATLTSLDLEEFAPGWIYICVFVGANGAPAADLALSVDNADLSVISADETVVGAICLYDVCFQTFEWDFSALGAADNVTLAAMTENNPFHKSVGLFSVQASTANPPSSNGGDDFYESASSNFISFTTTELQGIADTYGASTLFLKVSSLIPFEFPVLLAYDCTTDLEAALLFDTSVIEPNEASKAVSLDGDGVLYATFLFDSGTFVGPSTSSLNVDIVASYIARASHQEASAAQLQMGVYVGYDEEHDTEAFDYSCVSSASPTAEGGAEVLIDSSCTTFVESGLYTVDLFTSSHSTFAASVYAAATWYIYSGITYLNRLTESKSYHFYSTVDSCGDGVTFFIERTIAGSDPFYVSISQDTLFPDASFGWTIEGTGSELLSLAESDGIRDGEIFFTFTSEFSGNVNFYFLQGVHAMKSLGNGGSVSSEVTGPGGENYVTFHSDAAQTFGKAVFVLELINDAGTGAELRACFTDSPSFDTDECLYELSVTGAGSVETIDVDSSASFDWYIVLYTQNSEASAFNPLSYSLFAENFAAVEDETDEVFAVEYADQPFLVTWEQAYSNEATLVATLTSEVPSDSYVMVLCSGVPADSGTLFDDDCVTADVLAGEATTVSLTPYGTSFTSGRQWASFFANAVSAQAALAVQFYIDEVLFLNTRNYIVGASDAPVHGRIDIVEGRFTEGSLVNIAVEASESVQICFALSTHPDAEAGPCAFLYEMAPAEIGTTERVETHIAASDLGLDAATDNSLFFTASFEAAAAGADVICMLEVNFVVSIAPEVMGDTVNLTLTPRKEAYFMFPDFSHEQTLVLLDRVFEDEENIPVSFYRARLELAVSFDDTDPTVDPSEDMDLYVAGYGINYLTFDSSDIPKGAETVYATVAGSTYLDATGTPFKLVFSTSADIPQQIAADSVVEKGLVTGPISEYYSYFEESSFRQMFMLPCAGNPVVHYSYLTSRPSGDGSALTAVYPETTLYGSPFEIEFTMLDGSVMPESMNFFINITNGLTEPSADARLMYEFAISTTAPGPLLVEERLTVTSDDVQDGRVTVHFCGAQAYTEGTVAIRYGLFAMPVPQDIEPTYDASYKTACGLTNFAQQVYTDDDGGWVTFNSSVNLNDYSITSNVDLAQIDTDQMIASDPEPNSFFMNIVAQELDETGEVIGHTAYQSATVMVDSKFKPDVIWWQVALVVAAIVIGLCAVALLVYICVRDHKLSKKYEMLNLEGHESSSSRFQPPEGIYPETLL
eukprot:gnl/Chilomastix_cuspidata/1832.p1 GENE.gnl/Chilomastix_cuspidata/1832~~gnl/Chilomastix_cuspidata/1832.p1  ORF type:complete len:1443 (-),score=485.77 gnl/Chilomastix_cuspidata/1832:424-4440(-)